MKSLKYVILIAVAAASIFAGLSYAAATVCQPIQGCTGTGSIPLTGEVLLGNASGTYTPVYITPGTNITITTSTVGGVPSITIAASGGVGGSSTLIYAGQGILVNASGTNGYVIVNNGVTSTAGNWTGTWQGVNSTTFYLASNPSGYISNISTTINTAGPLTGGGSLVNGTTLNLACATCIATNTGNWAGTWINATSGTYYPYSNPLGFITVAPATTTINGYKASIFDLLGTGDVTSTVSNGSTTFYLKTSGVSAGSYTCASITVSSSGIVTAASTNSCSGGSGTVGPSTSTYVAYFNTSSTITGSSSFTFSTSSLLSVPALAITNVTSTQCLHAINGVISGTGSDCGGGSGFPVGTIVPYTSSTAPTNWLLADGTQYATSSYPDLFALIGYQYGGSTSTFAVPNLNGRFVAGPSSSISTTLGTKGGTTTISILQTNLPSLIPSISSPAQIIAGSGGAQGFAGVGSNGGSSISFNQIGGSSTPITTLPPYIVLQYIIKALPDSGGGGGGGSVTINGYTTSTYQLNGTTNQITITQAPSGTFTFSTPQNLNTAATAQFGTLGIGAPNNSGDSISTFYRQGNGVGNLIDLGDTNQGLQGDLGIETTLATADTVYLHQNTANGFITLGVNSADSVSISSSSIKTNLNVHASSTLIDGNATTTNLTISSLSGTQCLHEVSGVVGGTGSDCGSGGGGVASTTPFTSGQIVVVSGTAISTNGFKTSDFLASSTTYVASLSNNSSAGGIDFSASTGSNITGVLHSLAITQFTGNWVSTFNGATGTVVGVGSLNGATGTVTIATTSPIQGSMSGTTLTLSCPTCITSLAGYSTSTGANPTASVGLAAVNGSANTFMRSDAAPALSQSIAPTWTGLHTFTGGATFNSTSTFNSSTILTGSVSSTESSALILAASNGTWGAYGGASACSGGNAVTAISTVGGTTCAAFLTGTKVDSLNSITGATIIAAGTGIGVSSSSQTITVTNNGVVSTANNSSAGGIDFSASTGSNITGVLHSLNVSQFTNNAGYGQGTVTTSSAGVANTLPMWTSASAIGDSTISQPGGGVTAVNSVPFLDGGGDFIGPNIFLSGNSVIAQNATGTTSVGTLIQNGGIQDFNTTTTLTGANFCMGGTNWVQNTTGTITLQLPSIATLASSTLTPCASTILGGQWVQQYVINDSTNTVLSATNGSNETQIYSPGTPTSLAPGQEWLVAGMFENSSTVPGAAATGTTLVAKYTLYQSSTPLTVSGNSVTATSLNVSGALGVSSTITQTGGVVSLASTTINGNATTTNLTITSVTGTQCLHAVSGVVSGTGSDCGSGGGGGATTSTFYLPDGTANFQNNSIAPAHSLPLDAEVNVATRLPKTLRRSSAALTTSLPSVMRRTPCPIHGLQAESGE